MLSGLVGLRAHATALEISPLTLVEWFCVTRVRLRGSDYSVVWDAYGTRYEHGPGLHVWRDGVGVGSAAPLPPEGTDGLPLPPRVHVPWAGTGLTVRASEGK